MKVAGREKRFLLALVFSTVFLAFANYVLLPWGERVLTSGQQLTLAEKKLRQKRELVAAAPRVDAELKALEARLDSEEKRLLPTSDPSQASAQLQQWVSQRAAEQKVEVLRSDFLAAAPVGEHYVRVPVRLELNAPITQMVQFLNALTRGDRMVAIDELSVTSFVDKEKRVRCSMVVSALAPKAS